jgi:hypothetical protein
MEFWKENRAGDDCFGGRRFVEWLLPQATAIEGLTGGPSAPTLY